MILYYWISWVIGGVLYVKYVWTIIFSFYLFIFYFKLDVEIKYKIWIWDMYNN